jgi:tetratricopeptide (TPR) repeat protein
MTEKIQRKNHQMTHDEFYYQSCQLVMPYIRTGNDLIQGQDDPLFESNILQAIANFKEIIKDKPKFWHALWFLGKSYQALQNSQEAYKFFLEAHKIEPANPDVMRELGIECLNLEKYDEAVYYCQGAMEFDPSDYSTYYNLAIAKLYQGKLKDSKKYLLQGMQKKQIQAAQDNSVESDILNLIAKVEKGYVLPKFTELES